MSQAGYDQNYRVQDDVTPPPNSTGGACERDGCSHAVHSPGLYCSEECWDRDEESREADRDYWNRMF